MKTKKLLFPEQKKYTSGGKEKIYAAGSVHEVSTEGGYADRWIRRGAIELDEKTYEKKKAEHEAKAKSGKKQPLTEAPQKDLENKETKEDNPGNHNPGHGPRNSPTAGGALGKKS